MNGDPLLALVLAALPRAAAVSPLYAAILVGLVGLLVYGPYSLLAGALAVESGGARLAATAAGIIDGVGYVAGALAGSMLGRLLDNGGYALGFRVLAVVTLVAAVIALGLRPAAASRPRLACNSADRSPCRQPSMAIFARANWSSGASFSLSSSAATVRARAAAIAVPCSAICCSSAASHDRSAGASSRHASTPASR